MSLHRFFLEEQIIADERCEPFVLRLSSDDVHHARVLRLAPGEHIAVVDSAMDYFECEVVAVEPTLLVRVCAHADAPDIPEVTVVQGLAKGDKMDTVIRTCTELGVARFVPLMCERSVVRLDAAKAAKRRVRWEAVAKSAAMQSGQARIPHVDAPCGVTEALACLAQMDCVLVCWEEAAGGLSVGQAIARRDSARRSDAKVAIVIGPEGGLTPAEIEALMASNPHASLVSLGATILRTETAALVASALALYELGALGAAQDDKAS